MTARIIFPTFPTIRTPREILRHHGAPMLAAIVAQAIGSLLASVLLR